MSFGSYLLALVLPPVYLFTRGRVAAGVINGIFYLLAFPLIFLFGAGVLLWALCAAHAMWDLMRRLREETMQRHAELIAEKLRRSDSEPAARADLTA